MYLVYLIDFAIFISLLYLTDLTMRTKVLNHLGAGKKAGKKILSL